MNNLNKILNDLKNFVKDFENKKIKLLSKDIVTLEKYIFLYSLIMSKKLENSYGDILKEYILNVEKIFPSSSVNLIKYLYKDYEKSNLTKRSPTLKDLEEYFNNTIDNKDYIKTFINILKFSGPDCIIDIHESKLRNQIIKRKESRFDININKNFYSLFFNKKKLVKRSCGVIVVDGFIEKDQNLIPALEFCKEKNKTLLIVCRGMTSHVVNFLKNCIIKNKMTCVVYEKRFDDNDPFFFEDLAVSGNIDLIKDYTSLAFDIKEKIKIVDNIKLTESNISFYDSNKKIESKIKELKSLEINEDFIHKRVKRLKGEKVDIYTSNKDFIEFLKYAIKVYNKILKFGIYLDKNSNIIPVLEYDLISSIKKELEDKLRKIRYINYVKSTEKKLNAR